MSTSDKDNGNNNNTNYKSIKASTPLIVRKNSKIESKDNNNVGGEKKSWMGRKYYKIKKAFSEFWVVGKYGFKLGGLAGMALGFIVGGYEAVKLKSIWPIPIAMCASGMTFGSIFAISTVLRANTKFEMQIESFEMIYFDDKIGKYKKCSIPVYEKYYLNNKI